MLLPTSFEPRAKYQTAHSTMAQRAAPIAIKMAQTHVCVHRLVAISPIQSSTHICSSANYFIRSLYHLKKALVQRSNRIAYSSLGITR